MNAGKRLPTRRLRGAWARAAQPVGPPCRERAAADTKDDLHGAFGLGEGVAPANDGLGRQGSLGTVAALGGEGGAQTGLHRDLQAGFAPPQPRSKLPAMRALHVDRRPVASLRRSLHPLCRHRRKHLRHLGNRPHDEARSPECGLQVGDLGRCGLGMHQHSLFGGGVSQAIVNRVLLVLLVVEGLGVNVSSNLAHGGPAAPLNITTDLTKNACVRAVGRGRGGGGGIEGPHHVEAI